MNDPVPENIDGRKVHQQVEETVHQHTFDWGQIALGVAVIVAVWFGYWLLSDDEEPDQEQGPGVSIEVEGDGLTADDLRRA